VDAQQWIHVDVERAKAGPFGSPIAHGFLTLSLIPKFFDESLTIDEPSMGVNYGLNKVRFMAPVPVGSRLRGRLKLLATESVSGPGGSTGVQMTWEVKIERECSDKPVCVAESLARRYPMAA
jgi:acyl dehydratase